MRIGACRVRLACRLTVVLLVAASAADKAWALFDPGNDEANSKQSISTASIPSVHPEPTTGTVHNGSANTHLYGGSGDSKTAGIDETYLGSHTSLCFVESDLSHNICYEPRRNNPRHKEQNIATGENATEEQHAIRPESRTNSDGEEATSAAPEQSDNTLQAKEYDAWRERIGGQDAETWLSFDQWRDRYLAAEREKAEQERQRLAASKRSKTDRQNDKGNAAGKQGSASASPNSNTSTADDSSADVSTSTASKQNESRIEQDPSHGAKESQNERQQTVGDDSHTPASEHADAPSTPLQDQSSEDTAHVYVENVSDKGDAGTGSSSSGSTAVADPVGAIPALGNPSDELVNLKHRWNFASLDCAAVVHRTNPSAKFASSILSEKKDRYMLSPCPTATGEVQFVVVELCDEIKIDTLVLANFEFFSRMFKRFRVHASRNLNAPDHEWVDIGVFRARNMRGLQVFKTPDPSGDARFFRYIRIDFMEHYGSEYYCPLSLLRVYGLTQMDDYVREEEEMRKAREAETMLLNKEMEMDEEEGGGDGRTEAKVDEDTEVPKSNVESTGNAAEELKDADAQRTVEREDMVTTIFTSAAEPTPAEMVDVVSTPTEGAAVASQKNVTASDRSNAEDGTERLAEKKAADGLKTSEAPQIADPTTSVAVKHSDHTTIMDAHADVNRPTTSSPASSSFSSLPSAATTTNTAASLPSSIVLPLPITNNGSSTQGTTNNHTHGGSESIYRTITKRLNALEMNATLSLQYMEHSRQMLRETFVRMERSQQDKISQLLHEMNETNWRQIENLKKRQQSDLQQALYEFDLHRQQTDVERRALLAQVRLLSNEVMLEKRFGIAQLILLLCLFVFMALTRGSRAAPWVNESLSRLSRTPSARFGDHQPHQRYLKHSAFGTSRPNTPSSSGRATLSDDAASQVHATGRYSEQQRYTVRSPGLRSSEIKSRRTEQGLPIFRDGDRHPSTVSVRPLISGRKARRRRQGQMEYLVRLPGGINAKVPARRKGEKIVVPAQLISSPVEITPDLHAQTPSP